MSIFQPVGYCWDRPWESPNATHNIDVVLQMGGRIMVEARGQDFDPFGRSVLAPALNYNQQAAVLAIHKQPQLLVIEAKTLPGRRPWNGDSTGTGYHQDEVDLDVAHYVRHAMQAVAHFRAAGANIVALQVFQETDYAKWAYTHGLWEEWLHFLVNVTRAIPEAVDLPIVCGGQHGKDTHGGVQTTVSRFLAEGMFQDGTVRYATVHGNGKDIEHVVAEIRWLRNRGLRVLVTEDRGRGWNSHDSDTRAPRFLEAGAEAYWTLGLQRHCDQDPVLFPPDNDPNLWGVNTKHSRRKGAVITCTGFHVLEWEKLKRACRLAGQWDGNEDDLLPMGGPVDPPGVPMIDQAWEQYCWLRKEHDSHLGHDCNVGMYRDDTEARDRFDKMVHRLGRHHKETP